MATRRTGTKAAKPKPVEEEIEDLDLDDVVDEEEVEEVEETPAPTARRKPPARRKAAKPEPAEDEDDEPAPVAKRKPGRPKKNATPADDEDKPRAAPKRPEIEFGTQWLVELVNNQCGTSYTAYDLRTLLRKMAKNNELDREVGVERSRYSFTGPKDPTVIAVIKKVKSGDVETAKKASLDALKEKTAAKKAGTKKGPGRPKKAAPVVEDDDDEDVDDLD